MNEYQWKMKWFAGKINPEDALNEIKKAEVLFGKITAETVLNVAKDENSVLHGMFEWDDSLAAEKYRLSQARTIINNIEVRVVNEHGVINIPVFEIVRNETLGQQYKNIDVLTHDEISFVRETTIKNIKQLKDKLSIYKAFDKVIPHLEYAIDELNN